MSVSMGGGRQGSGATVVVALLLLVCAFAVTPLARASEFTVNGIGDQADAVPGVGCLSEQERQEGKEEEECTLRAAIERANSEEEFGTIQFDEEVFQGGAAATIALGGTLPAVTVPLFINGRTCELVAGLSGPCVGINGVNGEPALVFSNVEGVEVWGLAMTGAQTAIVLESSPRTKIQASWFGVKLDDSAGGNGTGILVGPGSNRSLIGGEGAELRDVFAGSAEDGLDIHGASNVRVFGNYFGVEPDGMTPRMNGGDDIEVASTGGSEATGTSIGTRVGSAAAASPQCDRGCNVISGAASNGIDLEGDGTPEAPAASTAIAGNYIGLDAGGTAAIPNTGRGVRVGEAAHTVVGGPSTGEANRLVGGSVGVLAGPAAADLSIRGNLIGTDASGTETLTPPDEGVVVDSAELPSPTVEAEIAGNEIGMEGGVAISQQGQGAWIFANRIFGAQIGIKTFESSDEYGNVIEGNLVEDSVANGVLVENDLNEIVGNTIFGAGEAGISIQGALLNFGVSGNLIGGDADEDENFIANSGGAAIEISNPENTGNEVARNAGIANGGLFVDLVAAHPGAEVGPNRGIQPPTFSAVTQTEAGGGAEAGATVRVFRKQLAAAGELESFLGEAIADENGGWQVPYADAIPAGTIIAATQTKEGATSELSVASTPGSESTTGGNAGGVFASGTAGALDNEAARVRPRTRILGARIRKGTVRFLFRSDQTGSAFLCKLDAKPFDLCRSPRRYVGLEPGRHVFWVRAIDSAGRVDLSPAKKKFVVRG